MEFNWEEFKDGRIAVHCDTEEKANDFLIECDKQNITGTTLSKATSENCYKRFKTQTSYKMDSDGIRFGRKEFYEERGCKIIKWEINAMNENGKTLKDVINTIQNDDVWEFGDLTIKKQSDQLHVLIGCVGLMLTNESKLTKKQKEYTFLEAMALISEGKTIKSLATDCMYKLVGSKVSCKYNNETKYGSANFLRDEIESKWIVVE